MHLRDVRARTDVLTRELLEPAPIGRRHARRIAARAVRLDQLAERSFEHRRVEPVERIPDALQQPHVLAELVDRAERPHARLRDQLVSALEKRRHRRSVQPSRQLVSLLSGFSAVEADAVPGRVVGPEAELAQLGRARQRLRRVAAVSGELLEGRHRQSRSGRRRHGKCGESSELSGGVENGCPGAPHRFSQRPTVIPEHGAQTHQRLVELGGLGLRGLLAAGDRGDEVATCSVG